MHACRTQQERLFNRLEEGHIVIVEIHEICRVTKGIFRDDVASGCLEYVDHRHYLARFASLFHP